MKRLLLVVALGLALVAGCDKSVTACKGQVTSIDIADNEVRVAYTYQRSTYVESYIFDDGDRTVYRLHNGENVTVYANEDDVRGVVK